MALPIYRPLARSGITSRQGAAFSTSSRLLNGAEQPASGRFFSLKNLGATRTTRVVLILSFLTIGFVEGVGWMKFGPKIFGSRDEERK